MVGDLWKRTAQHSHARVPTPRNHWAVRRGETARNEGRAVLESSTIARNRRRASNVTTPARPNGTSCRGKLAHGRCTAMANTNKHAHRRREHAPSAATPTTPIALCRGRRRFKPARGVMTLKDAMWPLPRALHKHHTPTPHCVLAIVQAPCQSAPRDLRPRARGATRRAAWKVARARARAVSGQELDHG